MNKIRYLLTLCLLMLSAKPLWATEGVTRSFDFRYVHLSLTQNDASFREAKNLLFKGRAMLLNDMVSKRVAAGELDGIKFDIQVYDPVISTPQLIVRRSAKRCGIILSGYPSIRQLCEIAVYALSHKTGLAYSGEGAAEKIAQFYKQNAPAAAPEDSFTVWSKAGLSVFYNADSLQYRFNNVALDYAVNARLPVKLKDRFLLFTKDAVTVVQQGRQITAMAIQHPPDSDFDCYVYAGWVNICSGGPENWYYSYAYKQNQFFKNPKFFQ